MERWTFDPTSSGWQDSADAAKFVDAIRNGKQVAVPTETVYGLAADATNGMACAGIFETKGRPHFNPLISHVGSFEQAKQHGRFDDMATALAEAFWPGPLTLVVPWLPDSPISDLARAGLQTVALRVPGGPVMRFLSERTGRPLAAPSANRSGKISPTSADDVVADLGASIGFVVDTGPCPVGLESTIVGLGNSAPQLLRPGGLAREDIERVLGRSLETPETILKAQPSAPGMLNSHYAPNAPVRLNASSVEANEALLSFGPDPLPGSGKAIAEFNLSPAGDLTEAAANLFRGLRTLDKQGGTTICCQFIPSFGLGEGINDRLRRAAAPRPGATPAI